MLPQPVYRGAPSGPGSMTGQTTGRRKTRNWGRKGARGKLEKDQMDMGRGRGMAWSRKKKNVIIEQSHLYQLDT